MEFFHTDEFEDVVFSAQALCESLDRALDDPRFWKQVILTAHATLQGACVCILTRTDGTGALEDKQQKALMSKLYGEENGRRKIDDDSVDWPEAFVATFPELLKRLPNDLAVSLPERNSRYGFDTAGDLRRLHDFRNMLVHFPPTSWSLELAGLPRVVAEAICLSQQIVSSSAYRRWNKFNDTEITHILENALHKIQLIEGILSKSELAPNLGEA